MRILAVDDDPVMLAFYQEVLGPAGYQLTCAEGGAQVDQLWQVEQPFDAVILDLSLADCSGLDLLGLLRDRYTPSALPILMVSANYDPEPMEAALDGGANDYLTKPVAAGLLLAKLRRHLAQAQPPLNPSEILPRSSLVGPYQIEALIGQGSLGKVYRARDTRQLTPWALKILNDISPQRLRFRSEVLELGRQVHPHLVRIEAAVEQPLPFIAMELLDGQTLASLELPLSCRQAVDWSLQILAGLEVLHQHGLAHLNLKPENCFVLPNHQLKLSDYGVAHPQCGNIYQGNLQFLGPPDFLAPEQIDASFGEPGLQSDLFAVGGILYWMVSGKKPFPADHPSQELFSIIFRQPRPLHLFRHDLTPGLESLCQRALEKRPQQRLQSLEEFRQGLLALEPKPPPN